MYNEWNGLSLLKNLFNGWTQKDPNLVNMNKRENEHLEDSCTLEEYRKWWATYDNRVDTMVKLHVNNIEVEKARHTAQRTLDVMTTFLSEFGSSASLKQIKRATPK